MADADVTERAKSDVTVECFDGAAELGSGLRGTLKPVGGREARLAGGTPKRKPFTVYPQAFRTIEVLATEPGEPRGQACDSRRIFLWYEGVGHVPPAPTALQDQVVPARSAQAGRGAFIKAVVRLEGNDNFLAAAGCDPVPNGQGEGLVLRSVRPARRILWCAPRELIFRKSPAGIIRHNAMRKARPPSPKH